MIAGADKGKVGEIVQVFPKTGKVVVEGVNMVTKHMKPRAQGETGSIEKRVRKQAEQRPPVERHPAAHRVKMVLNILFSAIFYRDGLWHRPPADAM